MRIIKAVEPIPVDHPVFLIFGQPGIGKSSLGYSCKDPLILDFDKGAHRAANRRDTLVIDAWSDVNELMDSDAIAPYSTLVPDTIGRALDVLTAHLGASDFKKFPGGIPSQQGWGVLKNAFKAWMGALRLRGKDVCLIAHNKEDKDGDTALMRPDIVGGSLGEVLKSADFIGFLYMNGRDRVLDFNPTDRWFGKNPANWKPIKVPSVEKAGSFMAELFDMGREALGNISDESARITAAVADWRTKFDNFTTVDECNAAITDTGKIEAPIIQAQAKKLLLDRAKALQFKFDSKAKKFIVAPQSEAVPA